ISHNPRGIFINQSKYALESLKKYGFESCDSLETPMVEKSKLDEDKEGKSIDPSHYRGMIGTLLYLTASRRDLQFAICMYARYQARPTEKHDSSIAVTAFADAEHAGCQDTRRSTSGSVQFLGERLISWSSKRQKSAAISSMEAEYIALSVLLPYAAIMSNTLGLSIRYHFIKEQVENGVIELYFANTEYQLADLFTKALGRDRIEFRTNKLGMKSFTPETLKQLMNKEDETMATTIDQQVALDGALVPSTKRLRIGRSNFRLPSDIQSKESTLQVVYDVLRNSPFFRAFQVTADVPEIYMQEFWAMAKLHHNSIHFKMDTKKSVLDLEAFREMLHISPRIPSQSFAELPSKEEILEFLRNSKAYKEYYACATGEAAPKPKESARKKKGDSASSTTPTPTPTITVVAAPRLSATAKGKQPARATTPTEPTYIERTEAEQLKIVLKRSRQERHISQQHGSDTDKGTGSRPGVPDVPSDDSEEGFSWNSSDDEDVDEQTKGREESKGDKTDESDDGSDDGNDDDNDETVKAGSNSDKDDDDNDDEEEIAKNDDEDTESGSEDEGSDEEDQELRLSKEARIQEEEEADELYRDVNINHGRGLQVTQNIEDSHVTLTLVHHDGSQESSSVSSFVTSMLNPISDAGVESIFTTASSLIVSLQTPTPIMTSSTIATITTSRDAPIPPTTIPSIILENLPTFNSAFRFDERLRSLETTFSEYRQTNPFVNAVYCTLIHDPANDEGRPRGSSNTD
nr:hypothetical protein [Tanacetum cinerariifolium]